MANGRGRGESRSQRAQRLRRFNRRRESLNRAFNPINLGRDRASQPAGSTVLSGARRAQRVFGGPTLAGGSTPVPGPSRSQGGGGITPGISLANRLTRLHRSGSGLGIPARGLGTGQMAGRLRRPGKGPVSRANITGRSFVSGPVTDVDRVISLLNPSMVTGIPMTAVNVLREFGVPMAVTPIAPRVGTRAFAGAVAAGRAASRQASRPARGGAFGGRGSGRAPGGRRGGFGGPR